MSSITASFDEQRLLQVFNERSSENFVVIYGGIDVIWGEGGEFLVIEVMFDTFNFKGCFDFISTFGWNFLSEFLYFSV
jgi:hypothetical protein